MLPVCGSQNSCLLPGDQHLFPTVKCKSIVIFYMIFFLMFLLSLKTDCFVMPSQIAIPLRERERGVRRVCVCAW